MDYSSDQENIPIDLLLPIAKKLFKQLATALKYLHDKFIAHRDLNPNNILLKSDEGGILKLTDFSISKVYESTNVLTTNSQITPMFEAPEMSENKHNPFKVDIYCFGACLFLFLVNNFDFKEKINKSIFKDDDLIKLIEACLAENPNQRPNINDVLNFKWLN